MSRKRIISLLNIRPDGNRNDTLQRLRKLSTMRIDGQTPMLNFLVGALPALDIGEFQT